MTIVDEPTAIREVEELDSSVVEVFLKNSIKVFRVHL